jgi:hypothetical protein
MTRKLTHTESELYHRGGWDALLLEETILEDTDRAGITEPLIVLDLDLEVLFGITEGGRA